MFDIKKRNKKSMKDHDAHSVVIEFKHRGYTKKYEVSKVMKAGRSFMSDSAVREEYLRWKDRIKKIESKNEKQNRAS